MRLQQTKNQAHEYDYMRGKVVFYIVGKPEEAGVIEAIDNAIGAEIYGVNGGNKEITWAQETCDYCPEYTDGWSCGWIMDKDDVDEFKSLWKKHKKLSKK